jgi:hypothetical protein
MVKLRSKYFAGNQVNVPHSEYRGVEDGPIVFDKDGFCEVPQETADFLTQDASYRQFVEVVPSPAKEPAPKASAKKSK